MPAPQTEGLHGRVIETMYAQLLVSHVLNVSKAFSFCICLQVENALTFTSSDFKNKMGLYYKLLS